MGIFSVVKQARSAFSMLNPAEVRRVVDRPVEVGLVSATGAGFAEMEEFLLPPALAPAVREARMAYLHRVSEPEAQTRYDLMLYEQGLPCPPHAFTFFSVDPTLTVAEILRERAELQLSLARWFPPFRKPVVDHLVHTISRENAMFAVATALPSFVPNLLELPWMVGEFASDTAFLTMNQVRMAFLVAAASGKNVSIADQKVEIASIVGGAFGWRAIARELAGKMPFGTGLIAKGGVAYAGTFVIGMGLEKFHSVGRGYSRAERREAYGDAFERGRAVVEAMMPALKKQPQA